MWQSQEVCAASCFFHSTGGAANLFSWSIYGSKQDANSGIKVMCHMYPHYPIVWTKKVEHGRASLSIKSKLNHVLC